MLIFKGVVIYGGKESGAIKYRPKVRGRLGISIRMRFGDDSKGALRTFPCKRPYKPKSPLSTCSQYALINPHHSIAQTKKIRLGNRLFLRARCNKIDHLKASDEDFKKPNEWKRAMPIVKLNSSPSLIFQQLINHDAPQSGRHPRTARGPCIVALVDKKGLDAYVPFSSRFLGQVSSVRGPKEIHVASFKRTRRIKRGGRPFSLRWSSQVACACR